MGRQCVKEDLPCRWDSVSVFCVTLPSQDQPLVRRDEEVLDTRAGHHPGLLRVAER